MSAGFRIPPDTVARQRRASNPAASVWVSANAGAGKTKVLTDRVIRLMLAGAAPSRILCLTFTKAAAAEMTMRVFQELGRWVTLDDAALAATLTALTGEPPAPILKARARRLFARAVETPGGLKIETIHAFCERVLHQVPFEANVPARFVVLDEAQSAELMAEARAETLTEAASRQPGFATLAQALETVSSHVSGDALTGLLDAAIRDDRLPGDPEAIASAIERLAATLGLEPGETPGEIRRAMVEDGIAPAEWPRLAEAIRATGKPRDASRAAELERAELEATLETRSDRYRAVFFKQDGEPRPAVLTKSAPAALQERLAAEQARLVGLVMRLHAAETVERTEALFVLAAAMRTRTLELKRRLGALDFVDLIRKVLDLLDRGGAPWVLYKLDRGIDHVLVDEAQDTNADQWRILQRLTEEFTAGAGRPVRGVRTIFAVGDPKQSIYSFQGADPRLLEESRRHWERLHSAARLTFDDIRLDLSFRSASTVLRAVDHTFKVEAHYRGLSSGDPAIGTTHTSARPDAPGHVEIWPTEEPAQSEPDPDAWSIPVDAPDPRSPAVIVANRVAQAVRTWTHESDPETGRVFRPGEILILARKRGPAFFAVIRALKGAGIRVAGADRIDINEQIAINDLVAAGQAALLPQNDLVLAAVLKSPLVGLDDDDLVRIAADRGETEPLVAALERAAVEGDARARVAWDTVAGWRAAARHCGPFGFYADLLGAGGGRRRLVERLGGEAADAIDVFLCRAQAEEGGPEAPSLTGFLHRFEAAEHVIKRDPEAAGDEVRVMTVHGAKGLEASLVVVLDGCDVQGPEPRLLAVPVGGNGDDVPVWVGRKGEDPPAVAAARAAWQARGLEEHNRLLYVAMTRARDRLVIAPFRGKAQEPPEAWCAMVRRGFAHATQALVRTETPYGPVDLWREGRGTPAIAGAAASTRPPTVPEWLYAPLADGPEPVPVLRPSGALSAVGVRPNGRPSGGRTGRAEARRRGTLVHGLVDHLARTAPSERGDAARHWLAVRTRGLGRREVAGIHADAFAVIDHPDIADLFGPGSRGEVAIAGRIGADGAERHVSGQMDRLLVRPDEVVVADLKTGRPSPDGRVPPPYLAQLALYRALLRDLHPGRPVRTLLVWTTGPTVVEPGAAILDEALAAALA